MISHPIAPTRSRSGIATELAAAALGCLLTLVYGAAVASARETVLACAGAAYPNAGEMQGFETYGTATFDNCAPPNNIMGLLQDGVNRESYGQTAGWFAHVPAGLGIVRAQVSQVTALPVNGYQARFQWDGDTSGVSPILTVTGGSISFDTLTTAGPLWAADFGFALACGQGGGCGISHSQPYVQVSGIQLTVGESPGYQPAFSGGNGLWSQPGWVRGNDWSLGFSSSSVAGICQESATLNGLSLPGTVDVSASRDQMVWAQCQSPAFSATSIDTNQFGQGSMPLTLDATDAVGVSNTITKTVYVDNSVPSVSLSGPTSAPSTAGTQYVTATGGASPSGIAQLQCSLDGGRPTSYKGATARVPVSGLGNHVVSCVAEDNAVDASGAHGWSVARSSWSLDIGQPTMSGIAFTKLVDRLKCKRVTERVKVPAKWVAVVRGGKVVQLRRRAHTKAVNAIKCRPRIVTRKVTVWVKRKRDGVTVRVKRKRVVQVVVLPHVVGRASRRVAFGRATTVSGWLGTSTNTALAGRTVQVMTSPDNGRGVWTQAAAVATAPDGTWTAQLRPGPSRLVEARYNGDVTTEPSVSDAIHLIVPAKVKLRIRPRRVAWGGTIRISGRVLGGFIPRGKLLRLRIGVAGIRETVGIPNVRRNGRFHTTWTFAPGNGVVRYWFSISTLNEADYPFAPGSSRRVYVTVGPG